MEEIVELVERDVEEIIELVERDVEEIIELVERDMNMADLLTSTGFKLMPPLLPEQFPMTLPVMLQSILRRSRMRACRLSRRAM